MRAPGGRHARPAATVLVPAVLVPAVVTSLVLLGGAAPALGAVTAAPAPPAVLEVGADPAGSEPSVEPQAPVQPAEPEAPVEPPAEPEAPVQPEPSAEPDLAEPDLPEPDLPEPDLPGPEVPGPEVLSRSTLTPGLTVASGCAGATVELPLVGPVTWWVDGHAGSATATAPSVPVDPSATTRLRAVLSQGATFTDGSDTAAWTVGPGAQLDTRCEASAPVPDAEAPAAGEHPVAPAGGGSGHRGDAGDGGALPVVVPAGTAGPVTTTTVAVPSSVPPTVAARPTAPLPAVAPAAVAPAAVDAAAVDHASSDHGTVVDAARPHTGPAVPVGPVDVVAASSVTPTAGPTVLDLAVAVLLTGVVLGGRHLLRPLARPATGTRSRG